MDKITEFRCHWKWLSNFQYFDKPMSYGGFEFPSNEHFYIAMKTLSREERRQVSLHPSRGLKKFGRTLTLREDWESIKLEVMEYGLRYKFSDNNPSLKGRLIGTEGLILEEGNYWNDKYWGICLKTGEGENNLGKIIMKIREELLEEIK